MTRETALKFLKIRKFKAFLFDYTGTCLFAIGCHFGMFFFRLLHSFGAGSLIGWSMFVTGQADDVPFSVAFVQSVRRFLIFYVGLSLSAACLVKDKQRIFFILYTGWFLFGCTHIADFGVVFGPFAAFLPAFVVSIFLRKKKGFLLRMNTLTGAAVHLCGLLVLIFLFAVFFFCSENNAFVLPG